MTIIAFDKDPRDEANPWTQTASGIKLDLLAPTPDMIHWPDVAQGLSRANRFNGMTAEPYSVAEHCCKMYDFITSDGAPPAARAWALLHDAHEAYIGDIVTPVPPALGMYAARHVRFTDEDAPEGSKESEMINAVMVRAIPHIILQALDGLKHELDHAIFGAAGFPPPCKASRAETLVLKMIDKAFGLAERNKLMGPPPEKWPDEDALSKMQNIDVEFECWPPERAAKEYLGRLLELGICRPPSTLN